NFQKEERERNLIGRYGDSRGLVGRTPWSGPGGGFVPSMARLFVPAAVCIKLRVTLARIAANL
ncbi:unnamed protein product, partial [Prunus brigantina]